jgi:hypothetical protein
MYKHKNNRNKVQRILHIFIHLFEACILEHTAGYILQAITAIRRQWFFKWKEIISYLLEPMAKVLYLTITKKLRRNNTLFASIYVASFIEVIIFHL